MTDAPRYAVFDLDLTITRYPTWRNFIRFANAGKPMVIARAVASTALAALRFQAGRQERTEVKVAALRAGLAGRHRDELAPLAEAFADDVMKRGLRARALEVIAAHRANGEEVVLASAAVDLVAEPLCRRLGIEHCIATPMGWEDDLLAGEFAGPNCYEDEKARRVDALLAETGGTLAAMYSDHVTDLGLLLRAEKGVAVNPSPRLKAAAAEHGIEVQDWDEAVVGGSA